MLTEMCKELLIVCTLFFCAYCYSFNTKELLIISDKNIKDRYFGYSLLLQKGNIPVVIVGAPKDRIYNNVHYGGLVYECKVNGNNACTPIFEKRDPFNADMPNGDFFGGALDGEDVVNGALVVCSPRSVTKTYKIKENIPPLVNSPGSCTYRKTISIPPTILNVTRIEKYYSTSKQFFPKNVFKSYYDFGYGLFGFDISFYNKDNVLFGLPGVKNANGATITFSLNSARFDLPEKVEVTVLPERKYPNWLEEDIYFGYSVDTIYQENRHMVCFLAGAPRGNNLKGKAVIYYYDGKEKESINIVNVFEGYEVGSYFGASVLAVDVNNDKIADIFIGAPMTGGKTYDEGAVYYYEGFINQYQQPVKLSGSSRIASRFGTAMVSLGDFDLDGYTDVAIAAPYEDDGKGTVYIYKGNSNGFINSYSQRLVPLEFNMGFRGFGLGMSRGNDIDQNGHNDIAIGAYKSDQVFVVRSDGIIDYKVSLIPSIKYLLKNTTNFDLELCLNYTRRSKILAVPEVKFTTRIILDYRAKEITNIEFILAKLEKTVCKTYNIKTKPNLKDTSPVAIEFELTIETNNIIGQGNKAVQCQIPYELGCGSDNICTTGLTLQLKTNRLELIFGKSKLFKLEISLKNDNEPAYITELIIQVPEGILLRNTKGCMEKKGNYTCLVSEKMDMNSSKDEVFVFNVNYNALSLGDYVIKLNLTSAGNNKVGYKTIEFLNVSIVEESVPFVIGESYPETMDLKRTVDAKDLKLTYQILVGKTGPLPIDLHVEILLPMVEYNGENIFHVLGINGSIEEQQVICVQTAQSDINWNEILNQIDTQDMPLNRTIMINCDNSNSCLQFTCAGDFLNTSTQVAVFEINMMIKSSYLVPKFYSELGSKDLIAFIPIASQKNDTDTDSRITRPIPFLIFIEGRKSIPLWIFLTAAVVGVILFLLIVMGLNQFDFFSRSYKEKLVEEQILISQDHNRKISADDVSDNELQALPPYEELN